MATITLDSTHIPALRKEVLSITQLPEKVSSLEDIDKVTRRVRAWREAWEAFAYTLRRDLQARIREADAPYDPEYNPNPPKKEDAERYLNSSLAPIWELNAELGRDPQGSPLKDSWGNPWRPPEEVFESTVKFHLQNGYASSREEAVAKAKQYHVSRPLTTKEEAETIAVGNWKAEAVKWAQRLRRKARKAWDILEEYITWLDSWFGGRRPLKVVLPQEEVVSIAGFRVVFRGFEDSPYKDKLEALQVGLAKYRAAAASRAPTLLRLTPPIFMEWTFEATSVVDARGYYTNNQINLTPWVLGEIDPFVKTLAHEVGHHLFRAHLSEEASEAWSKFILGGYRSLDLRDALEVMQRLGAKSIDDRVLRQEDPILYLQLSTLLHVPGYAEFDFLFAENIQKYLDDGGPPNVRVPVHPITGYAGKNSEEAFCEAIGNLVAYGPKSVPDVVLGMLKSVMGSGVKISSATRVASAWLAAQSRNQK